MPGLFALGAGASFIARAIDTDKAGLGGVFESAHAHDGATFLEIFQNCIVYNDGVFASFTDRASAAETQIRVEHGEPLLFGKENEKGLRLDPATLSLEIIDAVAHREEVLVHDETNATLAQLLLAMQSPRFPTALGVIYRHPGESYEKRFYASHPSGMKRTMKVADVLRKTNTWNVA